jgi:hypothetical protein
MVETSRLPHFLDNRLTDVYEVVSLMHQQPFTPGSFLVLISVRGWDDPMTIVQLERFYHMPLFFLCYMCLKNVYFILMWLTILDKFQLTALALMWNASGLIKRQRAGDCGGSRGGRGNLVHPYKAFCISTIVWDIRGCRATTNRRLLKIKLSVGDFFNQFYTITATCFVIVFNHHLIQLNDSLIRSPTNAFSMPSIMRSMKC